MAQEGTFIYHADGEAPRPAVAQGMGCLKQAVAVRIGFDDGHEKRRISAASEITLQGSEIDMAQPLGK
jgi:hypothetical protein